MLEIRNLDAYYGQSMILRNINLRVDKGQVVCILGRNGMGKTTLLKSIMGLVRTPAGAIYFDGVNIIHKPTYSRARLGIGYVPQGRDIFPQLTVYENMLLGLEIDGNMDKVDSSIFSLFPVLKDILTRKGGSLSGGQQQQLAIARALVCRPRLLILDEPTEGIQPSIIQDIATVIKRLKATGDMAILLVEQYLDFVMDLADYYYVMEKGTIAMEGPANELNRETVRSKIAI